MSQHSFSQISDADYEYIYEYLISVKLSFSAKENCVATSIMVGKFCSHQFFIRWTNLI